MDHRAAVYAASHPRAFVEYMVNNNPQGVVDYLNAMVETQQTDVHSEAELVDVIMKLANDTGAPIDFIMKMGAAIPHNDTAEGWANIKRDNSGRL